MIAPLLLFAIAICSSVGYAEDLATSPGIPNFGMPSLGTAKVHVFGDSHARFSFGPIEGCIVHWLGSITMHRVGRDSLSFLNISQMGVQENDTAVFVFGEIDVRCHIAKQRSAGREVDEIITTLVTNYIAAVCANKSLYKSLNCLIFLVLPPADDYNPDFPFQGTLKERIRYTKKLNRRLAKECKAHKIGVIDVYDDYATSEGSLNSLLSDGKVHIGPLHTRFVKAELMHHLRAFYTKPNS